MIRVNKGRVKIKGDMPMLLSELTCLCYALKESILEDGKSEEKAKKCIQECLDMAFMSEEELDERVRKAMVNMLERIGVKDGSK